MKKKQGKYAKSIFEPACAAAQDEKPEKIVRPLPGSSLKMFTEHFINTQPHTVSPKSAALLPTYALIANENRLNNLPCFY